MADLAVEIAFDTPDYAILRYMVAYAYWLSADLGITVGDAFA